MLQSELIYSINNPNLLSNSNIADLEAIVNEYPFFETAHLLFTKGLKNQNSLQYAKQLRKTAILANSRVVLHELMHSKEIAVLQVQEEEKIQIQPTKETPIVEPINKIVEDLDQTKNNEIPAVVSNITTTSTDVKVIYINTIISETKNTSEPIKEVVKDLPEIKQEVIEFTPTNEAKSSEIEVLQTIENETEPKEFDIDKLNKVIEQEISRSVIQSYVESDILKTPEFDKVESNEPVSFTDWLQKIKKEAHTIQKIEEKKQAEPEKIVQKPVENTQKGPNFNQNRQIIDKIIESDPGKLKLGTNKFFTPNLDAKQSLLENEHLVTETLAKIYALQGNVNKAIRAYEILSLKFPQKSVYFATLIQNLKNNK